MHRYEPTSLRLERERAQRIERAKESLAEIEAFDQVAQDLEFWKRRIRWAIRFRATHVTNALSFRGDVSQLYLKHLSKRLGTGFTVDRTYDSDDTYCGGLVVVKW